MTGEKLKISIFGQSHGAGIGVVIDGLPAGETVDEEELARFLRRRAPGGALATKRKEADAARILSGLLEGKTCGAPLCAVIENTDTRSGDYAALRTLPRPSHADYPAWVKYGGANDVRGGGHFSARLTAPLCVAGGIAKQLLARRGVFVGAHLERIGAAADRRFSPVSLTRGELEAPASRPIAVLDEQAGEAMQREIETAAAEGDSVGGIVECAAIGLPVGLGEPIFGGVENRLSAAVFGIPAVRGIEFGAGFAAAQMRGSAHNDPYVLRDGRVVTETNNHGGVLGGLTSGMPLLFRVCFKPTPSIARVQKSVDLEEMREAELAVRGRHDPCVALRAVPCVEAAAAVVLLDMMLMEGY